MDLPSPDAPHGEGEWEGEREYDVLSLSLVLNYVPDAKARGDMLRRTTAFFETFSSSNAVLVNGSNGGDKAEADVLPCLFLVLPLPCVQNSRYLTTEHLKAILNSLGYTNLHEKITRKLYYSLWRYDGLPARREWSSGGGQTTFRKKEINLGAGRNNFCIVLDEDDKTRNG